MQDQITALQPELVKKAAEIESLMVVIEAEAVDVESQKEVLLRICRNLYCFKGQIFLSNLYIKEKFAKCLNLNKKERVVRNNNELLNAKLDRWFYITYL